MTKKQYIINYVKEQIKSGNWKPGKKIPSEEDIAVELGCCKNTVRLTFSELEKNYLDRRHGSGTFIKNKEKKYILITTSSDSTEGDIKKIYRFFFKIINKYIIDHQLKPIYFVANNVSDIKNSIEGIKNEIAGAIDFYGNIKDLEYISKKNIPIITTLKYKYSVYPNVLFDYYAFYNEIIHQIQINKSKNVLVFAIKRHRTPFPDLWNSYPFCLENEIFSAYDFHSIDYLKSDDFGEEAILNILDNINKKPDMVIFLDDNLFSITKEYFDSYNHIFKKCKIVTHSNVNYSFRDNYDITRVHFDFYKIGKAVIDLMFKIINKEDIIEHNILIKPEVIKSSD